MKLEDLGKEVKGKLGSPLQDASKTSRATQQTDNRGKTQLLYIFGLRRAEIGKSQRICSNLNLRLVLEQRHHKTQETKEKRAEKHTNLFWETPRLQLLVYIALNRT